MANYANGVKRLILRTVQGIPEENYVDIEVCLSQTKWIMSKTVACTLLLLSTGHLLLTYYLMRKNRIISFGELCVKLDDDYYDHQDCNDIMKREIPKTVFHNLDMLSDWWYVLTVPAYAFPIQVMIISFILLPILIIFITSKDEDTGNFSCSKFIFTFCGCTSCMNIDFEDGYVEGYVNDGKMLQGAIFIFEDGP